MGASLPGLMVRRAFSPDILRFALWQGDALGVNHDQFQGYLDPAGASRGTNCLIATGLGRRSAAAVSEKQQERI